MSPSYPIERRSKDSAFFWETQHLEPIICDWETKLLWCRQYCKSFSVHFASGLAKMMISSYLRIMEQDLLKKEVERLMGRKLIEARDFEQLSNQIFLHTRDRLSPTTLKRLWGYLRHEEVQTRQHTLDVLARFVGYKNYEAFCRIKGTGFWFYPQ